MAETGIMFQTCGVGVCFPALVLLAGAYMLDYTATTLSQHIRNHACHQNGRNRSVWHLSRHSQEGKLQPPRVMALKGVNLISVKLS